MFHSGRTAANSEAPLRAILRRAALAFREVAGRRSPQEAARARPDFRVPVAAARPGHRRRARARLPPPPRAWWYCRGRKEVYSRAHAQRLDPALCGPGLTVRHDRAAARPECRREAGQTPTGVTPPRVAVRAPPVCAAALPDSAGISRVAD